MPQISCFALRLKCFSSDSIAPMWGLDPCFSSPTCRSSLTNIPALPTRSFILLSFAWVYIFFSAGQVLLSGLSWCSAFTSVSEGVSLMYPWKEIYFMSAYSSAILFSEILHFSCRFSYILFIAFTSHQTEKYPFSLLK